MNDLGQILEIEKDAFPKTAYPRHVFLHYAHLFPDTFFVAETEEEIAGYIISDRAGHIHSTAIRPSRRRKGLGRMLFMHTLQFLKKRLWLEVRSKNPDAINFYKSMGMKIIGKERNYYGNDDALIMALDAAPGLGTPLSG
ncbi:MAG: GNAT family N-acetyltransferase [Deltaproteobacteria bacterium]|nr:GNAT family N-acetyltransferase [Deltaproteobacteria bacterium]